MLRTPWTPFEGAGSLTGHQSYDLSTTQWGRVCPPAQGPPRPHPYTPEVYLKVPLTHKSWKRNKRQIRRVWQRPPAQRASGTLCLRSWLCLSFQAPLSGHALVSTPLSQFPSLPEELQHFPPLFYLSCICGRHLEAEPASCLSNELKLSMVWKNGQGQLGVLVQQAWLSKTLIWICVLFQPPAHAAHRVFQAPQTIWIFCSSCGLCFTPHLSITLFEGAEGKQANSSSVNQAADLLSTEFASICFVQNVWLVNTSIWKKLQMYKSILNETFSSHPCPQLLEPCPRDKCYCQVFMYFFFLYIYQGTHGWLHLKFILWGGGKGRRDKL